MILTQLSVALLLLAAFSKLFSLMTDLPFMDASDPIFLIRNRYLVAGVAAIEMACVVALLRKGTCWFKGLVLVWLGTNFLAYRLALFLSGTEAPCPCLGSVGRSLGISSAETDLLTKGSIAFLLIAGGYLLIQHLLQTNKGTTSGGGGQATAITKELLNC